jgi:hypothetical protein
MSDYQKYVNVANERTTDNYQWTTFSDSEMARYVARVIHCEIIIFI